MCSYRDARKDIIDCVTVSPMTQGSKMHLTVSTVAVDCLLTAYLDWWCDFRAACL